MESGHLAFDSVDGSDIRLNQLKLVVYPILYRLLYIPGGDRQNFFHQQWGFFMMGIQKIFFREFEPYPSNLSLSEINLIAAGAQHM